MPLDYAAPDGEEARIAVLRVPARGTSKGPRLLNSGGSGGSGQNFAAQTAIAPAGSPVTENFDLIGFDPRDHTAGEARTEFVLTACVNRAVAAYLVDLRVPSGKSSCTL
ncbi:hypothetical protein ACWDF9_26120 [Streptomyces rubiginosohelvolus]